MVATVVVVAAVVVGATVVVVVTGAAVAVLVAVFEIRIQESFRFTRPQTILTSETFMTLPAFEHRALCLPAASTTDEDPTNRHTSPRPKSIRFPMKLLYLSGFANHHAPVLTLAVYGK